MKALPLTLILPFVARFALATGFPVVDVEQKVREVANQKMILDEVIELAEQLGAQERTLSDALELSRQMDAFMSDLQEIKNYTDDISFILNPHISSRDSLLSKLRQTNYFIRRSKDIIGRFQHLLGSSEGVTAAGTLETNSLLKELIRLNVDAQMQQSKERLFKDQKELQETLKRRRELDQELLRAQKMATSFANFPKTSRILQRAFELFRELRLPALTLAMAFFWIRVLLGFLRPKGEAFFELVKDILLLYFLVFFFIDAAKILLSTPELVGPIFKKHFQITLFNPSKYESWDDFQRALNDDSFRVLIFWGSYYLYNLLAAVLISVGALVITLGVMGRMPGLLSFLFVSFFVLGLWPVFWGFIEVAIAYVKESQGYLVSRAVLYAGEISKIAVPILLWGKLSRIQFVQNLKTQGIEALSAHKKVLTSALPPGWQQVAKAALPARLGGEPTPAQIATQGYLEKRQRQQDDLMILRGNPFIRPASYERLVRRKHEKAAHTRWFEADFGEPPKKRSRKRRE